MKSSEFVPVAEVVKAVGLKGEVKLYPLLDWFTPLLDTRYLVWQDGALFDCRGYRPSGNCVVARLAGVGDRDAAEQLVGRMLGFDRTLYADEAFPRPSDGLPFRYLDREVRLVDGTSVGVVEEVRYTGAQYVLVVIRAGREVLIPAVEPILREDAGMTGPLVIDPPEGLLDVAGD